jgi:transcriptional regulator with XRE-family HTH domain
MDGGRTTDPLLLVAARLDRLRRFQDLSLESLAKLSGLDRVQVESVLAGKEDADIPVILKLAGALETDPGELFDGIAWVPSEDGGEYRVEDAGSA